MFLNHRWISPVLCLLVVGCSTITKQSIQSDILAGRYDQAETELGHVAPHLSSENYEELYGELCAGKGKSALASKDWAGALDDFDCAIQRNPGNEAVREDACAASYSLALKSRDDLLLWKSVGQRCSGLPRATEKLETALREQARVLADHIDATIGVCRHTSCAGMQNYEAAEDSIQQYDANPFADRAQVAGWREEIRKQREADQAEQQREAKLHAERVAEINELLEKKLGPQGLYEVTSSCTSDYDKELASANLIRSDPRTALTALGQNPLATERDVTQAVAKSFVLNLIFTDSIVWQRETNCLRSELTERGLTEAQANQALECLSRTYATLAAHSEADHSQIKGFCTP